VKANQSLQDEILERTRLEREILQVSSKEQQRIGQELHDGLGQELTGLSYLAHSMAQRLKSRGSPEADTAVELASSIPRISAQIKDIVNGLIPLEIGADDLHSALAFLVTTVEDQTGVRCRLESDRRVQVSDKDRAIQIYRIAQEAITNAIKHAHAQNVCVSLEAEENEVRLTVRDDGVGIPARAEEGSGCGLRTMKYRARAIGGAFEARRAADGGTMVACVFPRPPRGFSRGEGRGR
jgi:two-component system CheB/CheR fusion protein